MPYTPKAEDFVFAKNRDTAQVDVGDGGISRMREIFLKFKSSKANTAAVLVLALLVLSALLVPVFSTYSFSATNVDIANFPPRVPLLEHIGLLDGSETLRMTTGDVKSNPYLDNGVEEYHWFGTDALGRDVFVRCFRGLRTSLIVAAAATLINLVIGIGYGTISAYFGGAVDIVMQRIIEVLGSIPQMIIVTLLVMVLKPGITTLIIAFMLTGWMSMSQIARTEVLRIKEQEYVLASRTLGAGSAFIIFRTILPNIMGLMLTQIMVSIPNAIFTESFLSVVGLGIASGEVSLGTLIQGGLTTFFTHPHRLVPPVVIMALFMITSNQAADGLRDALGVEQ